MAKFNNVFIVTAYPDTISQQILQKISFDKHFAVIGDNSNSLLSLFIALEKVKISIQKAKIGSSPKHPFYGSEKINYGQLGDDLISSYKRNILSSKKKINVVGIIHAYWISFQEKFGNFFDFLAVSFKEAAFIFLVDNPEKIRELEVWKNIKTPPNDLENTFSLIDKFNSNNPENCFYFDCHNEFDENYKKLLTFLDI